MIIGTVRVEEARALSSYEGTHSRCHANGEEYARFEVFWSEYDSGFKPGWYWMNNDEFDPHGPFASSAAAHTDAEEAN